jgi:hypothetical protein
MYGPYLTIAEITAKYPDEWILIGNPTSTRQGVTGGYVILHAADRAEFYRLMSQWDDPEVKHLASWYTGEIGKGLGEILPPAVVSGR